VENRTAVVGVIGLGYVGLPLAVELARSGYRVLGFDISERAVEGISRGESHIQDVPSEVLRAYVDNGMISATTDLSRLAECDAISICVPTPLNKIKDPDLSYVVSASHAVLHALRPGQLVILESTTYPGTTREVVLPILEESGLAVGEDFFLCFSPERVDPGNPMWHTRNTPKVIGGVTEGCLEAGMALYSRVFDQMVPVESAEAAELVKVYENTFRMINIALANELAQACDKLGVDVWEVVEAASTKPFGFMRFTPGPGLGGTASRRTRTTSPGLSDFSLLRTAAASGVKESLKATAHSSSSANSAKEPRSSNLPSSAWLSARSMEARSDGFSQSQASLAGTGSTGSRSICPFSLTRTR
jgi:UDP-N-acetyl-D-glucosamine dehydrogenase